MFAAEYARGQAEKDKERKQITPLIQKVPGTEYPPIPTAARKGKGLAAEGSRRQKRKRAGSHAFGDTQTSSRLANLPRDDTEAPSHGVHIPNHTFLNKSVLRNTDDLTAMHYVQGISPSADWATLKGMDNDTFTREYALAMSKALPFVAQSFARARIEYQDPKVVAELREAKERVDKAEKEKDAAIAEVREYHAENKKLKEQHAAELKIVRDREAKLVEDVRRKGIEDGHKGFIHSPEGLQMIDRIRGAARDITLHSDDLVKPVVECTKFYVNYLSEHLESWKASGEAIEAFSIDALMATAPDAPRLQMSAREKEKSAFTASEFLSFLESADSATSTESDDLDALIEGVAEGGVETPEAVPLASPADETAQTPPLD